MAIWRRNFGSDQTLGGDGETVKSESSLTAYALGSGLGRPRYLSEKAEAARRQDVRLTVIELIFMNLYVFSPKTQLLSQPEAK